MAIDKNFIMGYGAGKASKTNQTIIEETDAWLEENISQETGYVLDRTLTLQNAAAPADMVGDLKSAFDFSAGDRLNVFGKNIFSKRPTALNNLETICEFTAIGGYTYTIVCGAKETISSGAIYIYVYKDDGESAWKSYILTSSIQTKTDSITLQNDTKITIKYLEQTGVTLTGVIDVSSNRTKITDDIEELQHLFESIDYRQIAKTDNMLVKKDGSHDASQGFYYKRYDVTHLSSVKITPNFTNTNYGYATYNSAGTSLSGSNYSSTNEITVDVTGCTYIDVTSEIPGESIVTANFTQTLRKTLGIDDLEDEASYLLNSPLNIGIPVRSTDNYFLQDNGNNTGTIASALGFKLLQYDLREVVGNIYVKTILNGSSCIGFYVNGIYSPVTKTIGKMQIPQNAESLFVSLYTGGGATIDDVEVIADFSVQVSMNRSVLYGKKIGVFGDSIVLGNGYAGGWAKIIADRNHMSVDNAAVSGGTIMTFANHSHIPDQVENIDNDCDYLIFDGGVNDFALQGFTLGDITSTYSDSTLFDTNTFIGSLEKLIFDIYADQNRISTKIGYVFNHRIYSDNQTNGSVTFEQFDSALKGTLKKWGVPYIDISGSSPSLNLLDTYRDEYTAHSDTYPNGDGWHPNKAGYEMYYCNKIESWLKTL